MKNLYFDGATRQQSMSKRVIYLASQWLTRLSPWASEKLSKKILANPFSRRKYDMRTRVQPEVFLVKTRIGCIYLQKFSLENSDQSKNILLCHGWGDSCTRYTQLIDHLLLLGFCVWSFDQIGHGKSSGRYSHLFAFIEGTEHVLNFMDNKGVIPQTIVGHSMGALSVLNLPDRFLREKKIVLISMPAYLFDDMFNAVSNIGIAPVMLTSFLDRLSIQYQVDWTSLSAQKHLKKITQDYLFIHDRHDMVCSFDNIEKLLTGLNYQLYASTNLGHIKLLKNEILLEKISNFAQINSESTISLDRSN